MQTHILCVVGKVIVHPNLSLFTHFHTVPNLQKYNLRFVFK